MASEELTERTGGSPAGLDNTTSATSGSNASRLEVIELWRLPLTFYELPLEEQWKCIAKVTKPAVRYDKPRQPCPMSPWNQAAFIGWSLVVCGMPIAMVLFTVLAIFLSPGFLKYWIPTLIALALHPIEPFKTSYRRQQIGLLMARYFSMTVIVDRSDPLMEHWGTPEIDKAGAGREPIIPLACPHGVMNFGAVIWVFFARWISGKEQYTAGAPSLMHIPGLRYLVAALWFCHADKKSLKKALQETPRADTKRGGTVALCPDGIAGIFHSSPGTDVLYLGKKRGLMRLAYEEGALLAPGWFPGTTDTLTVVQDPFGILKFVSRKLKLSLFLFYGRWGLPIPRRSPTSICPHLVRAPKIAEPTDEDLERLHHQVYGGLAKKYNEELKYYTGYSDRTLVVE